MSTVIVTQQVIETPLFEAWHTPTPLEQNRLNYLNMTRPDNQNGGFAHMSDIFESDIQGLNGLFGDRLLPKQIYEICVPEGDYKEYLFHAIPNSYEKYAVIREGSFKDIRAFTDHIKALKDPYDLLLLDVSELQYAGVISNFETLRDSLIEFYDCLESIAELGTTIVVFINFFYYSPIYCDLVRPNTVQIHFAPSKKMPPFWEVTFVNPPELVGRRILLRLLKQDMPLLIALNK